MSGWTQADFPPFGDWSAPGPRAGAVVFVLAAGARALMQLRDIRPGVVHGGLWRPFGGGVEAGESLAAAALREVREETGVALAPEALAPLGRVVSDTPQRARLYAFAARAEIGPADVRLSEGAGFALLTPAQLRAFAVVPVLRPLALIVADRLEDGA